MHCRLNLCSQSLSNATSTLPYYFTLYLPVTSRPSCSILRPNPTPLFFQQTSLARYVFVNYSSPDKVTKRRVQIEASGGKHQWHACRFDFGQGTLAYWAQVHQSNYSDPRLRSCMQQMQLSSIKHTGLLQRRVGLNNLTIQYAGPSDRAASLRLFSSFRRRTDGIFVQCRPPSSASFYLLAPLKPSVCVGNILYFLTPAAVGAKLRQASCCVLPVAATLSMCLCKCHCSPPLMTSFLLLRAALGSETNGCLPSHMIWAVWSSAATLFPLPTLILCDIPICSGPALEKSPDFFCCK